MTKKILQIPLIKQLPKYCAPATLSRIFAYYGESVDQRVIGELANLDIEDGVYPPDLIPVAKKFGYNATSMENTGFEDIKIAINNNQPLIARTQSGNKGYGHLLVINGYDNENRLVYFADPHQRFFDWNKFNEVWKVDNYKEKRRWKTNNYSILVAHNFNSQ